MTQHEYDVVVIGGGASGMMAAEVAATRGKSVVILEKNARLGEKVRISGGGRCNITNAETNERALLAHYGDAEPFLYSAFSQFGVADTFSYFESRGLPLIIEARKRAFPKTQKAADVCRVFARCLEAQKVTVRCSTPVSRIETSGNKITQVVAGGEAYRGRSYVLATGGVSHPKTGSTGDGFRWLKELGHTIIAPTPTLVPLVVRDEWVKRVQGVTLSDMTITFYCDEEKLFAERGPILFTHFGLSGPLIINAAGRVAAHLERGEVTARINCMPGQDSGAVDRAIVATFAEHKNRTLKNALRELIPSGLATAVLSLLPQIDPELPVHSVTKDARRALATHLQALPVSIAGLQGKDRAIVADGGVPLTEIDTRTMRSKQCNNLFITGDLLHINRPSGGYSLQLCWTTGFVAGTHA